MQVRGRRRGHGTARRRESAFCRPHAQSDAPGGRPGTPASSTWLLGLRLQFLGSPSVRETSDLDSPRRRDARPDHHWEGRMRLASVSQAFERARRLIQTGKLRQKLRPDQTRLRSTARRVRMSLCGGAAHSIPSQVIVPGNLQKGAGQCNASRRGCESLAV